MEKVKTYVFILLALFALKSRAQDKQIIGTILDSDDNNPIPGATVRIKGTTLGATTDGTGKFKLLLKGNETLTITAMGYKTEEVDVNNRTNLSVRLTISSVELNSVVVTALGIKRDEKALGYAITKIDSTDLTNAISNNWTDALSGKVAGLNLIRSNGGPVGSNKIILRGENNLTGENEALIVLDGVVINNSSAKRSATSTDAIYNVSTNDNMPADYGSSINDINPEDIESVTVLKGPAAAALYGQRGANGAIIITTKAAASRKKKTFNIKLVSNGSMETINRWPDFQYEYGQGSDGANYYSYNASADGASTRSTNDAWGPSFSGQSFFQYDPVTQTQGAQRTLWVAYPNNYKNFFNNGYNFSNTLSIDGKVARTGIRFSATRLNNTWIMPNTGFNRTSFSLSTATEITKKLKISTKVNYGHNQSDNLPGAGYGNQSIMYALMFWPNNADIRWAENYWVLDKEGLQIKQPFSTYPQNIYAISYEFLNKMNRQTGTGNVQVNYDFTKALSLMLRTSLDISDDKRAQDRPYSASGSLIYGSHREQKTFAYEASTDFMLKYNKKITKKINMTVSAGGSNLKNRYRRQEYKADGLTEPGIYSLENNRFPIVYTPDTARYNINSIYGLASFSYKNYWYVDVTLRRDWNSVLATQDRKDNVGFSYPSISTSFILSDYFKLPKTINYAKTRLSLAMVGSGSTKPYRTNYTYTYPYSGNYPDSAVTPTSILPNQNLKPLSTTTFEVGMEGRILKSRLNFDLAFYTGNTKNQILTSIVDRASGYNYAIINAGQVNNSGFELSLGGKPLVNKHGLNWTTNFTFSTNRNKIVSMPDTSIVLRTGPVGGGQIVAKVGGSMGDLYGRGFVRSPDGQIVYDATTGNAKITDDVIYLGNTIPKYRGSISNNFTYKGFSLKVLFDAQAGAVAHSLSNEKLAGEAGKLSSTLKGRYSGLIGRGVVQLQDGSYRQNTTIAQDLKGYYGSIMGVNNAEGNTFSTDFIKFREASLNYTFKPKLIKSIGIKTTTIGIYGRNLFIFSSWPMYDPEFGTISGTDIVQGFEIAQFPSTRTFGFNLIIGF